MTADLEIIARSEERYLLVPSPVADDPPADTPARILDSRQGRLFPPQELGSITAHNPYFEEYDPKSGETKWLLDMAEVER